MTSSNIVRNSVFYIMEMSMLGIWIHKFIFIGGVTLFVFANLLISRVFDKLERQRQKMKDIERQLEKSKLERHYYQYMEKANKENAKFLHDMNQYIRTAQVLLRQKNEKDVIELFTQIGIKMSSVTWCHYVDNKILNALLCEKKVKAEDCSVQFQINIDPDVDVTFLEEIDLISMIGNLLNNAIEAASYCEENAYVKIKMRMCNFRNCLIIEGENSFREPAIKNKKGCFLTTKNNKEEHGYGIDIIKKIVKKYCGLFEIQEEEQRFIVTIILLVNGKKGQKLPS